MLIFSSFFRLSPDGIVNTLSHLLVLTKGVSETRNEVSEVQKEGGEVWVQ
jgi:hypothetical protein